MSAISTPISCHPKETHKGDYLNETVVLPFSPMTCAIIALVVLMLTFHLGRWYGIQHIMNLLRKELDE